MGTLAPGVIGRGATLPFSFYIWGMKQKYSRLPKSDKSGLVFLFLICYNTQDRKNKEVSTIILLVLNNQLYFLFNQCFFQDRFYVKSYYSTGDFSILTRRGGYGIRSKLLGKLGDKLMRFNRTDGYEDERFPLCLNIKLLIIKAPKESYEGVQSRYIYLSQEPGKHNSMRYVTYKQYKGRGRHTCPIGGQGG
jgi:hypothetical protein